MNREDLALSEIFQRDDFKIIQITHEIFEKAILSLDSEQFVELFLNQGFPIHKYFRPSHLKDLFEKTEKREFFVSVILQGMLGYSSIVYPKDFIEIDFNNILKKLIHIPQFEIAKIYNDHNYNSARQAEKNALNLLTIYAILNNRHKLAKILWRRSEEPIPVRI